MPVYNAGSQLRRCLDSIRNQSYEHLQIILVDDGSQDDSLAICRQYAEFDNRFLVLSHENRGVSFTRNCGIDIADGDYLMFWDSDDYVLPDMVQRYLELAEANHADVVIGGIQFCERSGTCFHVIPERVGLMGRKELAETICAADDGVFGYVPNKLYRSSLIQENNICFREDMAAQEDLEFALSAYQKAKTFFLFSYCGYLYDYAPRGRSVPMKDLLGNQQKLLYLAEQESVDDTCFAKVTNQIRDLTFVGLFHSKNAEEIAAISTIPNLKQDIKKHYAASGEQNLVLKMFLAGRNKRIFWYFQLRNGLKKLLGKK